MAIEYYPGTYIDGEEVYPDCWWNLVMRLHFGNDKKTIIIEDAECWKNHELNKEEFRQFIDDLDKLYGMMPD